MATVELGDRYEAWIAQLLRSGRFTTRNAVLREGLRLLEQQEEARRTRIDDLRGVIREGDESGPAEPLDLDSIRAEARKSTRNGSSDQ
ncbi:type II toxin-antitoxin system ParD family antitoxin [Aureimonas psammosilenae]|uniref:type II toxin-antitoxin system ParD family antitoxin n=1 Tax=Aureimonas psammosilenae TaxID=2495496 RepID=UPI0012610FFE|nr:type II toxin-antitoxin system ParD family antitoxin [Aureimonas psammosilenae]